MLSDNVSTYALAAKELKQLLTSEEALSFISYPILVALRENCSTGNLQQQSLVMLGDVVLVHDDTPRKLVVMEED